MADLKDRKYCVIDIEAIALSKSRYGPPPGRYSKIHQCLRKVGMELWDGSKRVFEFEPCIKRSALKDDEKNSIH